MRTGKMTSRLRTAGVAVAALASLVLVEQPATAGPPAAMADRSCRVTTKWTCVTTALWVGSGANPHLATTDIPWSAPWEPGVLDPVNSFVIVRHLDRAGHPEILRQNRRHGDEHDLWSSGWPAGNYRAELHCPYGCQGASLYFDN